MSEKTQDLRLGDASVDLKARRVQIGGATCRLDPKSVEVLAVLLERRGQPVSRDVLLDRCWPDGEGSDEALTQIISQLRRALGDDSRAQSVIQTLPKLGYLIATDEAAASASAPMTLTETPVPAKTAPSRASPPARLNWTALIVAGLAAALIALVAVLTLGGNETVVIRKTLPPAATPVS